jgi:hypothetical protein
LKTGVISNEIEGILPVKKTRFIGYIAELNCVITDPSNNIPERVYVKQDGSIYSINVFVEDVTDRGVRISQNSGLKVTSFYPDDKTRLDLKDAIKKKEVEEYGKRIYYTQGHEINPVSLDKKYHSIVKSILEERLFTSDILLLSSVTLGIMTCSCLTMYALMGVLPALIAGPILGLLMGATPLFLLKYEYDSIKTDVSELLNNS